MEKGTYTDSAKRFKALLEELKITRYRFSKLVNYKSASTAQKLADGRTSITHKSATRIIEVFPQINFNYLIGKEKNIIASEEAQAIQQNIAKSKTKNEFQILNNKLDLILERLNFLEGLIENK